MEDKFDQLVTKINDTQNILLSQQQFLNTLVEKASTPVHSTNPVPTPVSAPDEEFKSIEIQPPKDDLFNDQLRTILVPMIKTMKNLDQPTQFESLPSELSFHQENDEIPESMKNIINNTDPLLLERLNIKLPSSSSLPSPETYVSVKSTGKGSGLKF